MILEACVATIGSAIEAQKGGADRVELCDNLLEGGTTPSIGTIRVARNLLNIGLFILVRPRAGDFLYSEEEFAIMKEDIIMAKEEGADGIVTGILTPDGGIDTERMEFLVRLARPMQVTFPRAFDVVADPMESLEKIIGLGIERILTSGQERTALAGAKLIRNMIETSAGRIIIMPGGGINEENIAALAKMTGAREFHATLSVTAESPMKHKNPRVSMGKGFTDEYSHKMTGAARVRKVREILSGI